MGEKPKLIKVEMIFDDGSIKYLEGEDAQIWNDAINSAVSFEWTHFQDFGVQEKLKKLKWKDGKRTLD